MLGERAHLEVGESFMKGSEEVRSICLMLQPFPVTSGVDMSASVRMSDLGDWETTNPRVNGLLNSN